MGQHNTQSVLETTFLFDGHVAIVHLQRQGAVGGGQHATSVATVESLPDVPKSHQNNLRSCAGQLTSMSRTTSLNFNPTFTTNLENTKGVVVHPVLVGRSKVGISRQWFFMTSLAMLSIIMSPAPCAEETHQYKGRLAYGQIFALKS